MEGLPVRLQPGDDLREALASAVAAASSHAAFVLSGIGSLSQAALRYAGQPSASVRTGDFEILSLAGTITPDGCHLHASVADAQGVVTGGHVGAGCIVRTTAEVLLMLMPAQWALGRAADAVTGYQELVVRRVPQGSARG